MNPTITGAIFLLIWIAVMLLLGGHITPNLQSDGGYEPEGNIGHPLWQ